MAYERSTTMNSVIHAAADERAAFIRRTYTHLAGAIGLFALLEYIMLGPMRAQVEPLIGTMMGGRYSWLMVLGAFMAVGWIADKWARSDRSQGMQYAGLGLYVVAESIIFLPILYIAVYYSSPDVLPSAGCLPSRSLAV